MKSRAVCCYCESISGENISREIDIYIVQYILVHYTYIGRQTKLAHAYAVAGLFKRKPIRKKR